MQNDITSLKSGLVRSRRVSYAPSNKEPAQRSMLVSRKMTEAQKMKKKNILQQQRDYHKIFN